MLFRAITAQGSGTAQAALTLACAMLLVACSKPLKRHHNAVHVVATTYADPSEVSVIGWSTGGGMAQRLASDVARPAPLLPSDHVDVAAYRWSRVFEPSDRQA